MGGCSLWAWDLFLLLLFCSWESWDLVEGSTAVFGVSNLDCCYLSRWCGLAGGKLSRGVRAYTGNGSIVEFGNIVFDQVHLEPWGIIPSDIFS